MIRTENLGKTYDDGTIGLTGLSLEVGAGEVFGLLGPNGAGKSTTVRLLNGTLSPSVGSSEVLGLPSGQGGIRGATATVAELAQLYGHLTVEENLRFFGALYDMPRAEIDPRIDELLRLLEIPERKSSRLASLSTGLKKRVQLARALLHRPRILFLDEPTSGLDPESARDVVGLVRDLARQQGTTVFLCTHNLPLAESICSSYGFLVDGSLVWSGTPEELAHSSGRANMVRITTDQGTIESEVKGDENINAAIIETLATGAHIVEVRKITPSLEEAYFEIVKGEEDESVAS